MKSIKQEHFSGCAVACVASILNISYKKALNSFDEGKEKAKFRGFFCKEIVRALEKNGLKYRFSYIGRKKEHIYPIGTIVFLKKDSDRPNGHYLCITEKGIMDPWINFPNLNARSGFRKRFPGKPTYAVIRK